MARSIVYGLLCAACAVIVMLAFQNGRLRDMNDALVRKYAMPSRGSWIPTLSLPDITGTTLKIGQPDERLQLLYFFNADCAACEASLPAVLSLQNAVRKSRTVELIGISRSPNARAREYADAHGLQFPIVVPDAKSSNLLGVRVVPAVLAVTAGGRVELSHLGTLDDGAVKKILATIPPDRRVDDVTMTQKEKFR